MRVLEGKRIVLGVSGGVAAYKTAELARELQRAGARVRVVMTEAGTRFVGTATFQALTGEPVFTDAWDTRIGNGMAHIDLSREADLILIAPATETTTAIDTFFRFLQLGTDIRKAFDQYIRDLSGRDPEHFSLRRIIPGQNKHRFFWIHDQDDDLTPLSDVQPLMVQSPEHVRFMITEGLGHRKIYRDNKVRQEIIGFLNGMEIPFHDQ